MTIERFMQAPIGRPQFRDEPLGANTYIGNAPNFMVYAIARRAGVNMPGFFSYMIWSGAILFPVFAAVTWLFLM